MMKQEDLFKKLGLILNELNEQYQFLAQNPHQLNELELELFHANASFLADHAQIVKKMALTQQLPLALPPAPEEIDTVNNHATENVQEPQQIEAVALAAEDEFKPEPEVNDEIAKIEISEPEMEVLEVKQPKIEEIEEEVFRLDNTPSSFEFILNDHAEHETIENLPQVENDQLVQDSFITNENKFNTDQKFEFESKPVDELFNRPLSDAEERVLAEKRKLSDQIINESVGEDEDEIGPEPFLVHHEEEIVEDYPIVLEDLKMKEAPVETTQINSDETVVDPSFKPTLNELLAGKATNGRSINSTSSVGIKDLRQAINLNDKLIYIKDLFNGYNLAYAEAIDVANKLANFEAADNFFQKNYAIKNDWASKQATVDKFYGLLNQRFK